MIPCVRNSTKSSWKNMSNNVQNWLLRDPWVLMHNSLSITALWNRYLPCHECSSKIESYLPYMLLKEDNTFCPRNQWLHLRWPFSINYKSVVVLWLTKCEEFFHFSDKKPFIRINLTTVKLLDVKFFCTEKVLAFYLLFLFVTGSELHVNRDL